MMRIIDRYDMAKKVAVNAAVLLTLAASLCIGWPAAALVCYAEDNLLYIEGVADYDKAYDVFNMINSERSKRGIATLEMDGELMDAAMTRAAETVLYFEHARPNGYKWNSVSPKVNGENLGKGTGSASKIMKLWMDSPGHRENVLRSRFRSVGVACFEYEGGTYWVQLYGTGAGGGADRPENGPISVGLDLPGEDDEGGFHLDYRITADGEEGNEEAGRVRMFKGESLQLSLAGDYLDFDPSRINWELSKDGIAEIDENGVLTITDGGKVRITASSGDIQRASLDIDARKNIQDALVIDTFAISQDFADRIYQDEPVCPRVTVVGEEGLLVPGEDYSLMYKDNEGEGTGIVEVRGIGDYGGIVTKEFSIG